MAVPSPSPGTAQPSGAKIDAPITREYFEVGPADGNIRQTLNRWAQVAGWTFNVEHWAVNVDVPIVGSATFDSGFKPAVRALLASTELGDRPLRPCFYSNKVVRVVPYAQVCDRTRNPGSSS
ncbi:MAG TPA: toxin co-regulated pilus biosynthesis Q family protein [Burkholderiaceae bacterium]|nr:toxin co-regulated pilus biosynthesis Q family protein [Burkholderiaceae bacterium]